MCFGFFFIFVQLIINQINFIVKLIGIPKLFFLISRWYSTIYLFIISQLVTMIFLDTQVFFKPLIKAVGIFLLIPTNITFI